MKKYEYRQVFVCQNCDISIYVFGFSTVVEELEKPTLILCDKCFRKSVIHRRQKHESN